MSKWDGGIPADAMIGRTIIASGIVGAACRLRNGAPDGVMGPVLADGARTRKRWKDGRCEPQERP
jgi:hypothetical protein